MSETNLSKKNSTSVLSNELQIKLLRFGFTALESVGREAAASLAARMFMTPRRHIRPRREIEILKRARSWSIVRRGVRLALWSWGEGPTVLLVHGWEGRGAQLGSFITKLTAAGYKVATFDGP